LAQASVAAIASGVPASAAGAASTAAISFATQQAGSDAAARELPVADQLATVLAPAAHQPDGSYQVNIRLQPEDLGVVNVELRLESGTVNVSLHAEGDATGDMLRQNLGQLRQQLANAGLTTGRFDVSTGTGTGSGTGTGQGGLSAGQERAVATTDGPSSDGLEQTETIAATNGTDISSTTSGLLDVRL
jgi:flagellar hook-length control protein FliK